MKWWVSKEHNFSDHNNIYFELETDNLVLQEGRNYKNADWQKFNDMLNKFVIEIPEEITSRKLDKTVSKVTKTLDKTCPIVKSKTIDKNNPWWTPQLSKLRSETSKLYENQKNEPNEAQETKQFKAKFKQCKKIVKKMQRTHFREKQENMKDTNEMAKYIKRLQQTVSPVVSNLKKKDGAYSQVGEETCREIMTAYYPKHEEHKPKFQIRVS